MYLFQISSLWPQLQLYKSITISTRSLKLFRHKFPTSNYCSTISQYQTTITMSSQAPTWDVIEEVIGQVRQNLLEQAECLTAQAATLDTLAVQIQKSRDGAQTTESGQSPIDCMNQIATLVNHRMNKMDQGFAEIHTKMLAK